MEKNIRLVARYQYKDGYFVEVSQENSAIAGRDYWLCNWKHSKKMFMFSSSFKNDRYEERMILEHIRESVRKYEEPVLLRA